LTGKESAVDAKQEKIDALATHFAYSLDAAIGL
jgi:hypothetical protein